MIDVNAFLGEWPFRRLPYAQPEDRLRKMDALGIEKAVVSRLENVFYKDLLVGNEELHAIVQRFPDRFIPAYTINPGFPGWEHDLDICINDFGMRNLRLHPNYHQYSRLKGNVPRIAEARGYPNYQQYHFLDDQAQALLGKAEEHDLVVLISIGVEDPRFAHWLMKVPSVTMIDAAEAVNGFPGVRFSGLRGYLFRGAQPLVLRLPPGQPLLRKLARAGTNRRRGRPLRAHGRGPPALRHEPAHQLRRIGQAQHRVR